MVFKQDRTIVDAANVENCKTKVGDKCGTKHHSSHVESFSDCCAGFICKPEKKGELGGFGSCVNGIFK